MKTKNLEVKIAVEEVIHTAFRELTKSIYEQHGITVDAVDYTWLQYMGGNSEIHEVRLNTRIRG